MSAAALAAGGGPGLAAAVLRLVETDSTALTCHVESFEERLEELKTLLPLHYAELALNQDKVPLSPQFAVYIDRERRGELIFMAMRQAGMLVGYFIGFIAPGLHYSTCLTCTMDIFYVCKEHRGSKTAGALLLRSVETEIRRRGVQRWFVGSKSKADASKLFEHLAFERVEVYYSKWIGD